MSAAALPAVAPGVPSAGDRALAATTARWLDACAGSLGAAGLGAAGLAAAMLLVHAPGGGLAATALLLAAAERVLALRLRFDAGLFADLAGDRLTPAGIDSALQALFLRRAPAVPASLAARADGARRLAWRHAAVVVLQVTLVTVQAVSSFAGWAP